MPGWCRSSTCFARSSWSRRRRVSCSTPQARRLRTRATQLLLPDGTRRSAASSRWIGRFRGTDERRSICRGALDARARQAALTCKRRWPRPADADRAGRLRAQPAAAAGRRQPRADPAGDGDTIPESFGFDGFQFATFFTIAMPVDRTAQTVDYQTRADRPRPPAARDRRRSSGGSATRSGGRCGSSDRLLRGVVARRPASRSAARKWRWPSCATSAACRTTSTSSPPRAALLAAEGRRIAGAGRRGRGAADACAPRLGSSIRARTLPDRRRPDARARCSR